MTHTRRSFFFSGSASAKWRPSGRCLTSPASVSEECSDAPRSTMPRCRRTQDVRTLAALTPKPEHIEPCLLYELPGGAPVRGRLELVSPGLDPTEPYPLCCHLCAHLKDVIDVAGKRFDARHLDRVSAQRAATCKFDVHKVLPSRGGRTRERGATDLTASGEPAKPATTCAPGCVLGFCANAVGGVFNHE